MKKLEGKSQDVLVENVSKIKELFPEVFEEGKINFDYLKKVLGDFVDSENEKYSFSWNGKGDAIKTALRPTSSTLRPDKESSKDWDNTENLFIEGDNLEVLKVLQDTYRNKIKMIYIDPPYNTGKDFVYNDNFDDSITDYKEKTSQAMVSNANTSGRYHTNWLNMMYPRLRLAKNLLKEDGVIFISIDDNEVTNLKKVCDEVFGEDNFLAQIVWLNKEGGGGSDSKNFKIKHEYIICYAKNINNVSVNTIESEENSSYSGEDEFVEDRGKFKLIKLNSFSIQYSKSLDYPIITPDGSEIFPTENNRRGCWRWSSKKLQWGIENKFIIFRKNDDGIWNVYTKQYFKVDNENKPIVRSLPPVAMIEKYSSTMATKQMETIFGQTKIFDYSKPYPLIKYLLTLGTNDDCFILDFFAGSGTTAHAVIDLNADDGGNRKFVLVQLAEETDVDSEACKAGYKTISEIAFERIRRAGELIKKENVSKEGIDKLDIGFKAFKLDSTNLTLWDEKTKDLQGSLLEQVNSVKSDRKVDDVLYEILLKYGIDLSTPITEEKINDKKVYSIAGGYLLICLEKNIDLETISKIAEKKPQRVVFYDHGFKDDMVKINAEQTLKKAGIEDIRII